VTKRLEILAPENFPLVRAGDDLPRLVLASLDESGIALRDRDVLVLAQKIVSKSEGRTVNLADVTPGKRARELALRCDKDARLVQLILDQSQDVIRCVPGVMIVRHKLGLVMANAGIDHSNVPGSRDGEQVLLLPEDPDRSASRLKRGLDRATGLDLAVIISDSFGRPWRLGTTGVCVGCAGIASLVDHRGDSDLFGRGLQVTQVAVGDELATAASVLMGQAAEGRPLVLIRGAEFPDQPEAARHLVRPSREDLFT